MVVRTSVKVMKFLVQNFAPFCVGINITTFMGLTVTCKAMLLLCSADLPARALISNMVFMHVRSALTLVHTLPTTYGHIQTQTH